MGFVGHSCHPARRELHEGLQFLALCRQDTRHLSKSEFETVLSGRESVRRPTEDEVLRNLQLETLRKAMKKLDAKDQGLLDLRYSEDLTMEEISKVYGVSKMAVSKRLRKLHEKLLDSVT